MHALPASDALHASGCETVYNMRRCWGAVQNTVMNGVKHLSCCCWSSNVTSVRDQRYISVGPVVSETHFERGTNFICATYIYRYQACRYSFHKCRRGVKIDWLHALHARLARQSDSGSRSQLAGCRYPQNDRLDRGRTDDRTRHVSPCVGCLMHRCPTQCAVRSVLSVFSTFHVCGAWAASWVGPTS